jgi:HAD superfamily hydrolase (TIGR01509 family)
MDALDGGGASTEEKRLGQVVQLARRQAGLTQQSLCQKSGLSYSTLAKIERGAIKSPSVFTIQHIAATLGISLDQLMQGVPSQVAPVAPVPPPKKVSRSGVRFVYFDMNGCLVRFSDQVFARLAEDAGMTPDIVQEVYWRFNDDINRGTKTVDEFNTALAERLGMMVDWNKYYLAVVEAVPGVAELLAWAAENYHVGILTNTSPNLVTPLLESAKLPRVHYDAIVESCIVNAMKPEAKIYEIATEKAGVLPQEILLVDDVPANLAGAAKAGWQTMSFNAYSPEESIVAISTALQPAD